jgi:hypothetical protein
MYPKGGNMLHTIRQLVDDDARWRGVLRGLNEAFRRRTVSGRQVQEYISRESGIDLSKVFEQYLTTTRVPVFEYRIEGTTLSYRWADVVPGFAMALRVQVSGAGTVWLRPTESWQTVPAPRGGDIVVDENFYVRARNVGSAPGGSR